MLNDEEKEALDKLSSKKNETTWDDTIRQIKREEIKDVVVTRQKYITAVLNLIEKQEKEISKLKIKNNDLLKKLRSRVKEIKKIQKYSLYKKEFSTLNKKIEKQAKEIEELKEDRDKFKKALERRITYCNKLEKDLFENCSNYVVSKDKIKAKIEENKWAIESYDCNEADYKQSQAIGAWNVLRLLLEKE